MQIYIVELILCWKISWSIESEIRVNPHSTKIAKVPFQRKRLRNVAIYNHMDGLHQDL